MTEDQQKLSDSQKNIRKPSVIFEVLRSFVELAQTLNVSQAATNLGMTRQTVKRHISQLEEIKGVELFDMNGRKYELTEAGKVELASATNMLHRLDNWLSRSSASTNSLHHVSFSNENGCFWSQQHQIHEVFSLAPPLLRTGLQAWAQSECELEHPKLRKIRPYLIIFRKHQNSWICVDVGEKSSFASWFGWAWAKSAVGLRYERGLPNHLASTSLLEAYNTVARTGGIWYDHVHLHVERTEEEELVPVNYQRLVFSLRFPNGEQAVASLIARTNNIQIDGFELSEASMLEAEYLMEESV